MKSLLFTFLSVFLFVSVHAQDEVYSSSGRPLNRTEKAVKSDKLIDPDRFIYGGWGVFGIGGGITNVGVTPIFGYRITEGFSAGIGFGYQYLRIKNYNTVIIDPNTAVEEYRPLTAHIYSPSVWARHIIWNNIFAHAEYEHNIFSQTTFTNDFTQYGVLPIIKEKSTINAQRLFLGGGIRQPIGDRASITFMLLYDVLHTSNSIYTSPLAIRFGINAGF